MQFDTNLKCAVEEGALGDEAEALARLTAQAALLPADRIRISGAAEELVRDLRAAPASVMERFLAEYGLGTQGGVALMCLAEALPRVTDPTTADALIADRITGCDWDAHLGRSRSFLVNAATRALSLAGRVLAAGSGESAGRVGLALGIVSRPAIRLAVRRAVGAMGRQFVLGQTIEEAMRRAARAESEGCMHSYDMLCEGARTEADAQRNLESYSHAISAVSANCRHADVHANPAVSVKLSALHPRFEEAQRGWAREELAARLRLLAAKARDGGMGLTVDAEETGRLSLWLDVVADTLAGREFEGWDGFGVAVQAYGKAAGAVLDHLHDLASSLNRRIAVRLVKGAYWDMEIKRAQVEGAEEFPVFTHKAATDISYLACARKLFGMTDRIYPQFATHNAHTMAAVLEMPDRQDSFEFQRLHGMGGTLHDIVMDRHGARCRVYAPVGRHRDLIAYLIRRLLENGANSSFVNQIADPDVSPAEIARDPFEAAARPRAPLTAGPDLFLPERRNSAGVDLEHRASLAWIEGERVPCKHSVWSSAPIICGTAAPLPARPVENPANPVAAAGSSAPASPADVNAALDAAVPWSADAPIRAAALERVADLYEARAGEFLALLAREAAKTLPDAVAELREAVDFLRYYAARIPAGARPAGAFACISPWNFPLAIFTGQVAAALAAGNAVLAKPAGQTPLVAHLATELMLEAGVPAAALQLLPGGADVGAALCGDPRVDGVAFTGSTATARAIRTAMAERLYPGAPFIAETGGLNAMVVDSTALPEQTVQAVVESAFRSAGQRCSALRCLYLQEEVAGSVIEMLSGAMDALALGDPWSPQTDVGPVIDADAQARLCAHVEQARAESRLIHSVAAPEHGHFVAPALIRVGGIAEIGEERFGPILHAATFRSGEFDAVVDDVNRTGYGLTFGVMTRIEGRAQRAAARIRAGNVYVNRNQIGAVVGSQPFGGEGLSGTGPKAGGPNYLDRFIRRGAPQDGGAWTTRADADAMARALEAARPQAGGCVETVDLPGPTGESNRLGFWRRDPLLCLGPGEEAAAAQMQAVDALGGLGVSAGGRVDPDVLETLEGISGAIWWGGAQEGRGFAVALSRRRGPILPLITGMPDRAHVLHERHVCIDTTAAGGNAELLAAQPQRRSA